MDTSLAIAKEQISGLTFGDADVLHSTQHKAERKYNLNRAMLLGNLHQVKVSITFRDILNKAHTVETTVWAVFDNYISLKGGRTLPIRSIERIEF